MDQATFQRLDRLAKDVENSILTTGYNRRTTDKWSAFTTPVLETLVDLYNILHFQPPGTNSRKKRSLMGERKIHAIKVYYYEIHIQQIS